MKIEIKETIVGTKPCEKVAEIISKLHSIEDACDLCEQLDLIVLEETRDDVSTNLFLSKKLYKKEEPMINILIHVLTPSLNCFLLSPSWIFVIGC